jgi:hypothetical protein
MNKNKFFSLVFILLAWLVSGSAIAADWSKNFGGITGSTNFTHRASAFDASGNQYVVGDFNGEASATVGSTTLTRIGSRDAVLVKLDSSGTVQWAKNYGGSGASTYGKSVAVDGSGNVYLGGYFESANLTTPALTINGDADAFVLKLASSTGDTTWSKNYGGSGAEAFGNSVAVDSSSNVYLGGYFSSADLTTPALTRIGNEDAFVFKLASNGDTTWYKNYGGTGGARARWQSVAVDGSGNVYLGGNFRSANLTTPALTKIGDRDAFVLKLASSTGDPTWANNYGGVGAGTYGQSVAVDISGNVYLGGYFEYADLATPTLTINGDADAFVLKLDSTSGNTTWAKNYGGTGGASAYGQSVAVDISGNVYLGGEFQSANLTTPGLTKIGDQDAFVLKLASNGTTTWSNNYGGIGAVAYGKSVAVDGSGNVYLGGYFKDADLTTPALSRTGITQNTFALKLNSSGATLLATRRSLMTTWSAEFYVNATAVDSSGNTYLAGEFKGYELTLGGVTLTSTNWSTSSLRNDAVVVKLNSSGTVQWAKIYSGSGAYVYMKSVAVDSSGNVYLGGYFSGGNLTTPALTKIGDQDAFVLKLDSSGNTTWFKNYGGVGASTYGKSVAVDGSGNVYLGGEFQSANLTTPALTKIGNRDAFVFKLASNGDTTWFKNYGGSGAQAFGNSVAVDSSGNVYLGGYFSSADLTTPALTRIGNEDAFVFKLASNGDTTWFKNYGGTGGARAFGNSVAVDSSGNVYLGGDFRSADLTTPALTRIGNRDAFAIKLASNGTPTWANNYGGVGADTYGKSVAVDSSGNVYLGGYFENADLTAPALTGIGSRDAFALKLDSSGTTTWSNNYGGSGAYAFGTSVAVDSSGNVYLGGYFYSDNLTTPALTRIAGYDGFVLKRATVPTANGACGTSANVATAFLPTANLCSTGTASNVTPGTSSWAWSCAGTGPSATNATCSAPYPVVSGGGGTVGAIQTPGTNGWQIDQTASGFVALPAPAPAGVTLPGGATKVVLNTGTAGTSATVTLRFSSIPAGAQLYKYGKENGIGDTNTWFAYPANIDFGAGTVTYTLTDGQRGDNDWTANSVIDDPVALGVNSVVASIPTLSEWGLIILSTLMALFGLVWMRRRQGFTA